MLLPLVVHLPCVTHLRCCLPARPPQYTQEERARLKQFQSIDYLAPSSRVYRHWLAAQVGAGAAAAAAALPRRLVLVPGSWWDVVAGAAAGTRSMHCCLQLGAAGAASIVLPSPNGIAAQSHCAHPHELPPSLGLFLGLPADDGAGHACVQLTCILRLSVIAPCSPGAATGTAGS